MEELLQLPELSKSPGLFQELKRNSIRKNYKSGSIILEQEAHARSIPIVVSGSLKVIRTEDDGREILLYYIRPGESCIMSFLGGLYNETSKVKAEVEEDAEILFLPIEKVHLFIRDYPEWLDYIFRLYHRRFEELLEMINAIAFRKIDERLLNLLHKKKELTGSATILITHEQLANELGTAREVVSRLLKQLQATGKVELSRHKITLLE